MGGGGVGGGWGGVDEDRAEQRGQTGGLTIGNRNLTVRPTDNACGQTDMRPIRQKKYFQLYSFIISVSKAVFILSLLPILGS